MVVEENEERKMNIFHIVAKSSMITEMGGLFKEIILN